MKTFIRVCILFSLLVIASMMTEKQILMSILAVIVYIYWDIAHKEK